MTTMTNKQIEQKKQMLAANLVEMSDEELDVVAGGSKVGDWFLHLGDKIKGFFDGMKEAAGCID